MKFIALLSAVVFAAFAVASPVLANDQALANEQVADV